MGQKVNPIGLRLGINRTWDSRWYAGKKDFGRLLQQDIKIREYLSDKLKAAGVSRIVIERPHKKCRVTIHSARPGVVIGKKGADIEKLKSDVQKYTTDEVHLNIVEIRKPEIDSKLVAENIAQQLERRVAFRRVMKRAVQSAQRLGALGIRIKCGGRLGGAEIARVEWYHEGRVPLHTLRADIDYGIAQQLERRVSFRRAMKRAVQSALRFGAEGIRVTVAGRIGGAEIARVEWYREGRVPLHTLRADIDYAVSEAETTYGIIGVKVWIYKGIILAHDPLARDKRHGGEPQQARS